MKDMVIKGTGNSRFLKSVENFLDLFPTYEAFAAAFSAGILPVDFNGINPEGITQMGTPYAKSTVLTDEVAALYGMDNTAVPVDVLKAIVLATFKMAGNLNIENTGPAILMKNKTTGVTGRVQSTGGGNVALARIEDEKNQRLIEMNNDGSLRYAEMIDGVWTNTQILHTGNFELLRVTGSYTGTGEAGSSSKATKIIFSIVPKIVIVLRKNDGDGDNCFGIWVAGCNVMGGTYNNKASLSDKTLSFYSTVSAVNQYNKAGTEYCYVALG